MELPLQCSVYEIFSVRLLMACMLAKVHRPEIDPRKPYTKIGSKDCFSGRSYDEQFIGGFITKHNLPCNSTTAFLTPTLRNMDQTLTIKVVLVGRRWRCIRARCNSSTTFVPAGCRHRTF